RPAWPSPAHPPAGSRRESASATVYPDHPMQAPPFCVHAWRGRDTTGTWPPACRVARFLHCSRRLRGATGLDAALPGPLRHTIAMTTQLSVAFTASNDHARPLHVIQAGDYQTWCEAQPAATQAWLKAQGFAAAAGTCVLLPGSDGGIAGAVLGIGDPLDAYSYAHAPSALPVGDW